MTSEAFQKPKDGTPKEITILNTREDFISLELKAGKKGALQILIAFPIIAVGIIGGLLIGVGSGQVGGFIFGILFAVGMVYGAIKSMGKKSIIKITPDSISISDKKYDRKLWGGFRTGDSYQYENAKSSELEFRYGGAREKTGMALGTDDTPVVAVYLNSLIDQMPMQGEDSPVSQTPEYKF